MLQKKVIILKKIKYAETNLILHTLSNQGERFNFMARSAVKSVKRFSAGTLEPLHYLKVSYVEARSGDLHKLKEAQIIEDFYSLRSNYECLRLSLYFLSLSSQLTQESVDGNTGLFNLLGNTLSLLNKLSLTDIGVESLAQLKLRFEVKALHQQGVCPETLAGSSLLTSPIGEHSVVLSSKNTSQTEAVKLKIYHALKEYLPNLKKSF